MLLARLGPKGEDRIPFSFARASRRMPASRTHPLAHGEPVRLCRETIFFGASHNPKAIAQENTPAKIISP